MEVYTYIYVVYYKSMFVSKELIPQVCAFLLLTKKGYE